MRYFNFLIKPASSLCNLRCHYCFYEDETNNRSEKSRGIMTNETVDLLLERTFSEIEPRGRVAFAFQGGEPTVAGLSFFQRFVDRVQALSPQHVSISYAIQTNGTLLDDDWAAFFKRHRFLVGISLDGAKSLHNLYRTDAAGDDTWNRAVRGLRLLQKHKVDVNALCVVTAQVARHPEQTYRTLKTLGFEYIQYIACIDPMGEPRGTRPWSLSPAAYAKFLCQLFDCWYQDWETGHYHSIRLFDDYIHILLGDSASTCATCGRCGSYFLVEADGAVYPCDFFALDDWCMGCLKKYPFSELATSDAAKRFLEEGRQAPPACSGCRYRSICNGGCRNDWVQDESGVRNYYCEAFRTLLDYALPRMRLIAQAELQQKFQ